MWDCAGADSRERFPEAVAIVSFGMIGMQTWWFTGSCDRNQLEQQLIRERYTTTRSSGLPVQSMTLMAISRKLGDLRGMQRKGWRCG